MAKSEERGRKSVKRSRDFKTHFKIELSISCTKLINLDITSKSDPICFLYRANGSNATEGDGAKDSTVKWLSEGHTEMISNNLNPKFSEKFIVEYHFEEIQLYCVKLYDIDDKNNIDDQSKQDFIGQAEFTLADVVTAGKAFSKELTLPSSSKCRGVVHIKGEEIQDSRYTITMKLSCIQLDKKKLFGKSDPFFEISKGQEGEDENVVYRSKAMIKTLDPKWSEFQIPIQQLCSGDWDRPLHFSVYDWNRSGKNDFIGKAVSTLRDLTRETGRVTELELINDTLKAKKFSRYRNSGILHFDTVLAIQNYTFMDYIRGGCTINLIVAIDFTSSNGKPTNPSSLHYIALSDPPKDNQYTLAIKSVGSLLAKYDSDQMIPVFGFGAKVPQYSGVSHCFPLNLNDEHPEVKGIQGVLDAYEYTLGVVELYGPTNFSSILSKAITYATSSVVSQGEQHYYILLIITDGIITDMKKSIDRIVEASNHPLSIVIVGVGNADFADMDVLDADDKPLVDSNRKKMTRDIIQFVPLMKHLTSVEGFSVARETMAEIPEQFMSYMNKKNIVPNSPVDRPVKVASAITPQTRPMNAPVGQVVPSSSEMDASTNPGSPPHTVVDQRQLQPQQVPPYSPHANGTIY